MKKERKPRNPWKITAISLICLIVSGAILCVVWLGAFSGRFDSYDYDGEPDRLDDSWGQINQTIEKPENWRRIVRNSQFQFGEFLAQYYAGLDYARYRFKDAAYPAIDGSTVMVALAMEFARQHLGLSDDALERFVSFSTTGMAYENLFNLFNDAGYTLSLKENGEFDYIQSTRPLDLFLGTLYADRELAQARMNGIMPIARPICKDAFVFITHKDNPVESLTLEQLRDIFSGTVTNWKDVGGADEAIRAFQREPGSGSQTGMEELVMRGTPMAPAEKVRIAMGMGMLIDAVAEYQNGTASIGYTYKYYIDNLYKNPDIKILQIDGIAPDEASIIAETYPLSVNYYGVIRAGDEQAPGGLFLDWILSEEGQACVRQAGYVPLNAAVPADIASEWAFLNNDGKVFSNGYTLFEDGTGIYHHNWEGGFSITSYTLSGNNLSYTFLNMDDEAVVEEINLDYYTRVKSIKSEGLGHYRVTLIDGQTKSYYGGELEEDPE